MNKKLLFVLIIYMLIALGSLCGCGEDKKGNELDKKIESEIDYLDKSIIGIMNKLNNITLDNYEVKSRDVTLQKENKSSGGQSDGGSEGGNSEEGGDSGEGEQKDSKQQDSKSGQSKSNSENSIKVLQMEPSNILVIDKSDIDWASIKSEIEIMYSSWNSILLDLHELNIKNEDILDFSRTLDNTVLTAKSEDKQKTLTNLANVYSFLPKYIDNIKIDESKKNIIKTKSNIMNAYALVEQENWIETENQINQADENYAKVTNDVKYIEKQKEKISRVYVLIKELKNSINTQDKDIFYIKYKNLMNSI